MRKRSKQVLLRLTPVEYKLFNEKVIESGLSKQKYLLALSLENNLAIGKEFYELTQLNQNMAEQNAVLNKISEFLSDISTFSIIFGELRDEQELKLALKRIEEILDRGEDTWLLSRSLLADLKRRMD